MIMIKGVLLWMLIVSSRPLLSFPRKYSTIKLQEIIIWSKLKMFGMLLIKANISINIHKFHPLLLLKLDIHITLEKRIFRNSRKGSLTIKALSLIQGKLNLKLSCLRFPSGIVIKRKDKLKFNKGKGIRKNSLGSNFIISKRSKKLLSKKKLRLTRI